MENEKVTEAKEMDRGPAANNTVKNFVLGAMGVGLIPIPIVDLLALTGLQLGMLKKLSNLYGAEFSQGLGKKFIGSLAGSIVPLALFKPVASLIKFIPFVGYPMAMVSMPIVSGASTYALGKVFIRHFETGGTFFSFEPDKMKKYYAEKFDEGKKVASDLKKGAAAQPA